MGCHTWFFNSIKDAGADMQRLRERLAHSLENYAEYPTFQDYVKDDGLYEEYCKLKADGATDDRFKAIEEELKKYYHKWERHCVLRNEMPQKIRSGELTDDEFLELYKKEDIFSTKYEVSGFSDNFRTFDYDTPEFHTYDFAETYLKAHYREFYIPGNGSILEDEKLDLMLDVCKRFFEQYPNGWIEFG